MFDFITDFSALLLSWYLLVGEKWIGPSIGNASCFLPIVVIFLQVVKIRKFHFEKGSQLFLLYLLNACITCSVCYRHLASLVLKRGEFGQWNIAFSLTDKSSCSPFFYFVFYIYIFYSIISVIIAFQNLNGFCQNFNRCEQVSPFCLHR